MWEETNILSGGKKRRKQQGQKMNKRRTLKKKQREQKQVGLSELLVAHQLAVVSRRELTR